MILARDIELWRRDPVETEKMAYFGMLSKMERSSKATFLAQPWAAYLNGHGKFRLPVIPSATVGKVFTVCQHIRFREIIPALKSGGVNFLFTPHALMSEPHIDGVEIRGFPHFPASVPEFSDSNEYNSHSGDKCWPIWPLLDRIGGLCPLESTYLWGAHVQGVGEK